MSYDFYAIFAVFRVIIGFLFVIGFVTPLFFRYAGRQTGIDRIVFSWVGLGGLLISGILILVTLHIYDFISIMFCLLMIPFLTRFFKRKWEGSSTIDIFNTGENRLISKHVKFIEKINGFSFQKVWEKAPSKTFFKIDNPYAYAAIVVGIAGSILRLIPSVRNASPFSRVWYFELEAVKNLSLQEYFTGLPTPKGMHSLIHFFSTITQVSPEMILHFLGSLISFFLVVIIFWVIRDLTRARFQFAALFGALIYAIYPTLFLPVSMEMQSELTSLSLAMCFALPTMIFFLRNIRSNGSIPWFYIYMGIIATGLTNIFVLIMVLFPFLLLGMISLPKNNYIKNFGKISASLVLAFGLTLAPFILYCLVNDLSISAFFQSQLFNTQVFTFAPNLVMPIDELSIVYFLSGVVLLLGYLIRNVINKNVRLGENTVFLSLFLLVAFVYTPYFDYQYIWIDIDQLNSFYGALIAIFFGIMMYSLFLFFEWSFSSIKKYTIYTGPALTGVILIGLFLFQGGFQVSRNLPKTEPNGFFDAYYKIINERIPFTYATVGPELDRVLAKNRHFFMNYQFFINNYGVIDSLYQKYLTVPDEQRPENEQVPPASIFLFVEKPPYGSIQQGILYDAQTVMRDMEQWLVSFRKLEGRVVRTYHQTDEAIIYEIVNRSEESTISGVLNNRYAEEEGRAARLFK